MPDELVRRKRALGADKGEEETGSDRSESAANAGDVFLAEDGENDGGPLLAELFAP